MLLHPGLDQSRPRKWYKHKTLCALPLGSALSQYRGDRIPHCPELPTILLIVGLAPFPRRTLPQAIERLLRLHP